MRQGQYIYRDDLLALEQAHRQQVTHPTNPWLEHIVTPLQVEVWGHYLSGHPDRVFTHYLLKGIGQGFRICFHPRSACQQAKRNLRSTYQHPEVVDAYLAQELRLHRVVRLHPSVACTLPNLQISPIGVIPKQNRPNKWRLIIDLSSPDGTSVNDGLNRAQCTLQYASIDDVVCIVQSLGPGALMAKLDLIEAYRNVPVHPHDRPLIGMRWRDSIYIDMVLPFGLRSAPNIFSALADGLIWIMHSKGVDPSIHYLDDFLLLGPPGSLACKEALSKTLKMCCELGVPVAEERTEGPSTALTFLSIIIDSEAS